MSFQEKAKPAKSNTTFANYIDEKPFRNDRLKDSALGSAQA